MRLAPFCSTPRSERERPVSTFGLHRYRPLSGLGLAAMIAVVAAAAVATVGGSVWLTQAVGIEPGRGLPLMATEPAPGDLAPVDRGVWADRRADAASRTPTLRRPPQASAANPDVEAVHVEPVDPAEADRVVRVDRPTFNGRPIRPAKTLTMKVTAYSPDERSCGIHADGVTASGYSVWTNGMKLVAADTRMLPFGSIISVPGYHGGKPVPVLDRGGKIKGHRLDVLYPTHEIARQWGVQTLRVTVWEYADE